jgi:adenylate cyclase
MPKKKTKPHPATQWLLFTGIFIFALLVSYMKIFRTLELNTLDYRFLLRGPLDVSESPIVILSIDDQSDASTPERWPWPREYFARVIKNLNDAGAKVIAIDVVFEQADKHGPESDSLLTRMLERYPNVVLAGKIYRTTGYRRTITTPVPPYEQFEKTDVSWGLVSTDVDHDGIYRRYLMTLIHNDSTYASFALETLKSYHDYNKFGSVENRPDTLICGAYKIPKYDASTMLINYAGPAGSFPIYSFDSVLDDENFELLEEYDGNYFSDPGDPDLGIPPGLLHSGVLKDKIVLIGSTMQELHDDFPTPFLVSADASGSSSKIETPGVEVHAHALQTILSGQYLIQWGFWTRMLIYLILMILVYIIANTMSAFRAAASILIITFLYLTACMLLFARDNVILPVTTPLILILFSFMGQNLYQYVLSQREKKVIRGAFSHYVPEKVVAEILSHPDKLKLGGEERVVTVLFSDISGFTTISEKMSPTELIHLLNDYLTEMSEIILDCNGIIDKFEGDAIMAEFGVPVPYKKHAHMACKAALSMQVKLIELREKWKDENRPQFSVRIGINTGKVVVGNLGSRDVFDYTVIGDHVNLGARLEGANKFYGTKIMISEFTHKVVQKDFHTRMLDVVRVKGKKESIRIYELLDTKRKSLDEKTTQWLQLFQEGVNLYLNKKWSQALRKFQKCLRLKEDDVTSREYVRRCESLRKKPPGKAWDGITTLTEK